MTHQPTTLPLAPRLPAGLVTPVMLRHLADIAEKYKGAIKVAGNSIVILGLSPQDRTLALAELGLTSQPLSAKAVRSVVVCAGKPYCSRAQQDSTTLGLALDNKFCGAELPGKLRIGISGCPNACSEVFVKDIGLFGVSAGYTVVVGGNSSRQARPGRIITEKISPAEVLPLVTKIIAYYKTYGQPGERLGQTMSRRGFEDLAIATGIN
ncbi:nitrite reductase [Sporomusa sp. KB1]|uniref:nitrite reductase n=1 Tax=Sporomusa sp. KB1 TaxID=943346 RepID=UPI0011A3A21D|nr:nitrite reductase [Sporomusa sp. KB1]TWH46431.1 NAD(P)H-nitrite reductase [Sporomusa sp. KB1]